MLNFYFSDCIIIFTPTFLNDVLVLSILAFYIFICLVIVFINRFTWHFGNVELILVICLSNYFLTNTYYTVHVYVKRPE